MMEISKSNPPEEMSKTGRGSFLKEVQMRRAIPAFVAGRDG